MGDILDEISQSFFDASPNPGFLLTLDFNISMINRAVINDLGLDPKDAVGKKFHDLFPIVNVQ